MKKIILFYLRHDKYGSMNFFNLALTLNKNYGDKITPLILTPDKHMATMANEKSLNCIFIKPFYNYLKEIPILAKSSPLSLLIDLAKFFFYKMELKPKIKKINPSWIVLASDASYNEYVVLSNFKKNVLVVQYTIDTVNIDEEIKYFSASYNTKRFSLFEKLIDKIIKFSPDYDSRFASFKGPYLGSPIKHFVLKFFKLLPRYEKRGGGNSRFLSVYGPEYINIYNNYGIPKSKIISTGNPEFDDIDSYFSNKQKIMEKVYDYFNINEENLIILFLQPPRDKSYLNAIRLILKSLMKYENNYIIVKTHPRNSVSDYYYLEKIFNCKVIGNDTGFNNKELIISSSFIITMSSTVGLIALALEVPLITFNFSSIYPNFVPESSIHCSSISEFNDVISNMVKEKSKLLQQSIELGKSAVKKFLKLDGKCTDRIFNILKT